MSDENSIAPTNCIFVVNKLCSLIDIIQNGVFEETWLRELDKLPHDINVLANNLVELARVDKKGMSMQDIHSLFHKHAILFVNHSEPIDANIVNKGPIWRARKNVNELTEDLSHYKTFSYPSCKVQKGRAHIEEHPIFYGTWNKSTALFEAKPIVDEVLYLGEWRSDCTRDVNVRILLPEDIPASSPLYSLYQKQAYQFKEMAERYGGDKAKQLELISRFIGDCFIEELPPYHLSSWLGHRILFDQNNLDLFYYASALNKTRQLNMAIKPTFVDAFLDLLKVYKIQITSVEDSNISFGIIEVGDCINEKVMWRSTEESDIQYLQGH